MRAVRGEAMSPKRKVLVIDDEPAVRKLLQTALRSAVLDVIEAASGKEGLSQAIAERPDFILLDLGLPDQDGLDVLSQLRAWYAGPILILSVRNQEETIVSALDRGADDYLTKPFHLGELVARIRVAERHHGQSATQSELRFGDVTIHLASRSVRRGGEEVRLTATEFDVLKVLVQNAGKVLTHRQLLRAVWGPNASEHVQYLRVYVGHLRQKLEADPNNPRLLLTEPGVGYRMVESTGSGA